MRYWRHESRETQLTIYPFVCWHLGAPQSDEAFIREHIYRVKQDPRARWLYMGDAGECITKHSKGDIFSQTLNLTEQAKMFCSLVEPIREKRLFGVRGNHGNRVYKETGMDFDEDLCMRMQMPYLGTAAFWHLKLKWGTFPIYTHHGIDSGISIATKITKAKAFEQFILADAIFSAHSHICCEIPPRHIAYLDDGGGHGHVEPVRWVTTRGYICGCAYDSRSGYAESKGYPPILPAHLAVTFKSTKGRIHNQKSQSCQVWRRE